MVAHGPCRLTGEESALCLNQAGSPRLGVRKACLLAVRKGTQEGASLRLAELRHGWPEQSGEVSTQVAPNGG